MQAAFYTAVVPAKHVSTISVARGQYRAAVSPIENRSASRFAWQAHEWASSARAPRATSALRARDTRGDLGNVRFGLPDIAAVLPNVRFTPESRHWALMSTRPSLAVIANLQIDDLKPEWGLHLRYRNRWKGVRR
jgi:hypothetical protein